MADVKLGIERAKNVHQSSYKWSATFAVTSLITLRNGEPSNLDLTRFR